MKKKTLGLIAGICSLGMMLSLSACGSNGGSSAKGSGDNIITAYNSEPQNALIPGDTNETGGGKVGQLLFANLIAFNAKGEAENEVADSIKPNADSTQYTITLKDGWKFTDGTPVTAESFTKAWSYVANAKNAQKCSSFFSSIKGYDKLQDANSLKGDEQLEGLKVKDDKTFTVDLNAPDSVFPVKIGYLAFAPLPESFYKGRRPSARSRWATACTSSTAGITASRSCSPRTPTTRARRRSPTTASPSRSTLPRTRRTPMCRRATSM